MELKQRNKELENQLEYNEKRVAKLAQENESLNQMIKIKTEDFKQ